MIFVSAVVGIRQKFISAVNINQAAFGLGLSVEAVEHLADYYELVQENNSLLHLVGPCSPVEFAVRHILESLALLEYLPQNSRFADVGTGAGLPSIPCVIVRSDLRAILIESKEKKVRFLEQALEQLGLGEHSRVINRQFEEVREKQFEIVTCRALDRFIQKIPAIVKWCESRRWVFFGGPTLSDALSKQRLRFEEKLIPMSERRYIFARKP